MPFLSFSAFAETKPSDMMMTMVIMIDEYDNDVNAARVMSGRRPYKG